MLERLSLASLSSLVECFFQGLLALPTNIRLGWKGLPGINALALFKNFVNYVRKKFYRIGSRLWSQVINCLSVQSMNVYESFSKLKSETTCGLSVSAICSLMSMSTLCILMSMILFLRLASQGVKVWTMCINIYYSFLTVVSRTMNNLQVINLSILMSMVALQIAERQPPRRVYWNSRGQTWISWPSTNRNQPSFKISWPHQNRGKGILSLTFLGPML
jgi:hypothetical protein